MKLIRQQTDAFTVDKTYALVFSINKDLDFSHPAHKRLAKQFPQISHAFKAQRPAVGQVIHARQRNRHLLGCVTTAHPWECPIRSSISHSFEALKRSCILQDISHLVMSLETLGVSTDRTDVIISELRDVFKDTTMTILLCP